jgi:hypothetical protein
MTRAPDTNVRQEAAGQVRPIILISSPTPSGGDTVAAEAAHAPPYDARTRVRLGK